MNLIESPQTTAVADPSAAGLIFSPGHLHALTEFANMMSKAVVSVPDHLKGKPADCLAIAMQAAQWGMNPYAVAQKTHIVSGRLGYEAQLVNAVVQQSRAIDGAFRYEFDGEGAKVACRVGARLRGDSEITWGEWLSADTVQTKNSPLWKVNPKQQLAYLQVKNWARLYCPGAILGVYTADELEVVAPASGGDNVRHMGNVEELPRGPRRKSEAAAATDATPASSGQVDEATGEVPPPPAAAPSPAAALEGETRPQIAAGQVAYLRNKLKQAGMTEAEVCQRYGVESIEQLNIDSFDELKSELLKQA